LRSQQADTKNCSPKVVRPTKCEAGRRKHLAELHFVVLTNLRNSGDAGLRRRYFFALRVISSIPDAMLYRLQEEVPRGKTEAWFKRTGVRVARDAGWTVFGHSFHSFHDRGLCEMNAMKLVAAIDSIGNHCCCDSYTT